MEDVTTILDLDKLLFYDVEVFEKNAIVVFKDIKNETVRVFHNEFEGLRDLIRGKTLIGFNNYHYDDEILSAMLLCKGMRLIKQLNDKIINKVTHHNHIDSEIVSLDCFQQISLSFPSLKKIEGNMGKGIVESSVSFDIDRKLTGDEIAETIRYCEYDVESTIEIFKLREKSYFRPKLALVQMLPKNIRRTAIRWNTTTISANIITDGKKDTTAMRTAHFVKEKWMSLVPTSVQDIWNKASTRQDLKRGKVTIRDFDNDIEFGYGGIHAVNIRQKRFKNVKILDVTSMYPSIAIQIKALGAGTKKYAKMLEERVKVKHTDVTKSNALKLALNSAYGNLNNKYSILNNPCAAYTICFTGQIVLYELAKRLSETCTIVQLNTDGVAFVAHDDEYKQIWKDWEAEFKLNLELDEFKTWIQKDVNNYVALKKDGSVYTKGGMVNKYQNDRFFDNNDTRIVHKAIVDRLLFDKDVTDTLVENLDRPELYQYVLSTTNKFAGTVDQAGNPYQKVNRVFAAKSGVSLRKLRHDGAYVKFADAPDQMMVWNKGCDEIEDFESKIDLTYYYNLIQDKLRAWS